MDISIQKLQKMYYGKWSHKLLESVTTVDRRLPAHIAKGTVIVLHGYRSHIGVMRPVMDAYFREGYNQLGLEIPNHGTSIQEGCELGDMPSFHHCVNLCRSAILSIALSESRKGKPIFIVGNSTGAIIALHTLQTKPLLRKMVAGVVCMSTPLDTEHSLNVWLKNYRSPILRLLRWITEGRETEKGDFVSRMFHPVTALKRMLLEYGVDKPFFAPSARDIFEEDPEAQADPLYYKGPLTLKSALIIREAAEKARKGMYLLREGNVLFLHGGRDHITPISVIKSEHSAVLAPSWTIVEYPGGHDLLREHRKESIEDMTAWVRIQTALYNFKKGNMT